MLIAECFRLDYNYHFKKKKMMRVLELLIIKKFVNKSITLKIFKQKFIIILLNKSFGNYTQ